jgi:hypothetical protein
VPSTSYTRSLEVNNGCLSISAARGALQTGSNITIGQFDYGFLSVFDTHYVSNMHYLKVIPNYLIVDFGGISIWPHRVSMTGNEVTSRHSDHGFLFLFC